MLKVLGQFFILFAAFTFAATVAHAQVVLHDESVDGDLPANFNIEFSAGTPLFSVDTVGDYTVSGSRLFDRLTGEYDQDAFYVDLAEGLQITSLLVTFSNTQTEGILSATQSYGVVKDSRSVENRVYGVSLNLVDGSIRSVETFNGPTGSGIYQFAAAGGSIGSQTEDVRQSTDYQWSFSVAHSVPEVSATGAMAALGSLLAMMAFLWERRRSAV